MRESTPATGQALAELSIAERWKPQHGVSLRVKTWLRVAANPFHQRSDTRDFGSPELAVLEVDIVDR